MKIRKRSSVFTIAIGAVISALAVVIMQLGAMLEIADLTGAMLASILVWFLQIEFSTSIAISTYFTVSILSFIILPSKLPTFYFVLLYGWYPILKYKCDRIQSHATIKIIIKVIAWSIAVALEEILARNLLGYIQSTLITCIIVFATFISYILYDFLLKRIAIIYQLRWRKHLFKN